MRSKRWFFFRNDGIVLDRSVRSRERTIIPPGTRPALLAVVQIGLHLTLKLQNHDSCTLITRFYSDHTVSLKVDQLFKIIIIIIRFLIII